MALVGQPSDGIQSFGEAGERVVSLRGAGQDRGGLGGLGLQGGLALLGLGEAGLGRGSAFEDLLLVRLLLGQLVGEGDDVVGEESEPGVAEVGLDDGGAPGQLGLAPEGLELATQLRGEVGDPVQVALHRVELADRLLFALAVLEDARGLLDERPTLLRSGVQDGVELSLADDDVHLAADAGVTEQVLDVEQAAGVAVDRVLRTPVAEHRPPDGDLGVVDRQGTVGVVDGEADLGAAEGLAGGGAREDHVLHLAAAQGLGALFAHHPGEGVDDVGLARAVGAHHAGDPGFETQGGGRRERLEAAQRQVLQVHPHLPHRPPGPRGPLTYDVGARCDVGLRTASSKGATKTVVTCAVRADRPDEVGHGRAGGVPANTEGCDGVRRVQR